MMFMLHIDTLLASIVLLASTGLIIWSLRNKGAGCFFGKVIGSVVLFISILSIICSSYASVMHWKHGGPMGMGMGMGMGMMGMHHKGMMGRMMPQMMGHMGGMGPMMGGTEGPNESAEKDDDHTAHHPS